MNLFEIVGNASGQRLVNRKQRTDQVAEMLQLWACAPSTCSGSPMPSAAPAPAHRHRARLSVHPRLVWRTAGLRPGRFSTAQILNLLLDLQKRLNLTYIFVATTWAW